MRRMKQFAPLGLALMALMVLYACAKQGYPTGGPKDEKPPVVLGTTPQNGTTNFDAKEFYILFDEYVQVKSADENILVSPPMKQKPEYSTKGRGILVKIKDTLRENTTYLFQFKEGIVDFNEGNPLKSFEYVFSTGTHIDSMTLRGKVLDAYTNQAWKEPVTVVAYLAEGDSATRLLPCGDSVAAKEHPMYMTRCDKEGNFELNHLRQGHYLLLAYEDGDKNLRLGNNEAAAFLDTLVLAQKMPITIVDTATQDTTAIADTAAIADTIAANDTVSAPADSIEDAEPIIPVTLHISLFKQDPQHVTKCEFTKKGRIELITQCPLSDTFALRPLYDTANHLYYKPNRTRDTLQIWTAREGCDSITLLLTDTQLDDTLKLQYREKKTPMPKKPAIAEVKPSILHGRVTASHPYFDTLWFDFDNPVADSTSGIGDSVVSILHLADSSISYCGVTLMPNIQPMGSDRAYIDFIGKAGEKYKFSILPNHFTDIYGNGNTDSLHITTEYTKTENYGNIILDIDYTPTTDTAGDTVQLLLQLTDEKGNMLQQRIVTKGGRLTFPNLKGGKYGFRVIVDTDGNREWTPGDYWKKRQPERIILFEKTLELRENWDMEEKWVIEI